MAYNQYGVYGGAYGYGAAPVAPAASGEDKAAGAYNPRYHFAAAQNAGFQVSGDDSHPRTLYVGNLDPSVTEEFLATLFGQIGVVTKTKVIFDGTNDPYAFIEFADHASAAQALQTMNKRSLLEREMKVNWATEPGQQTKVDTSKHYHVFIGDLSPEVDNKALKEAFQPFGEVSDAKVIRDPGTLKSKGYGFVSYPKREEAERAIEQMNGQWLGRRTIRTNWATRKPTEGHRPEMNYEDVFNQTGPENCSVYVGNVAQGVTDEELRREFSEFGRIEEIRLFKLQGYAFVRFDTKESACRAIIGRNGSELAGQNIRCSWGKTDTAKRAGAEFGAGYGAYGTGAYGAAAAAGGASGGYGAGGQTAAAQQAQYWQYYQQYYQQNPQMMQQWQNYYQQNSGQGGQGQ